ncbi:uncharacterized protein LOC143150422 [Ptiloglossa arizonensis]|uniref:uncharacterized protein LOC143150422 n=1 Tax=Ptiloglossa arizonensis TaxID=3350558 RepID=UPI003F9FB0A5
MGGQIFAIVALLASFGSVFAWEQIAQEYGTAKYGEKCVRDRNCIEHAFCRGQVTCVCEQYYSPTPDKSMCIASEGLFCTDESTCRSMTFAECKQGKCSCRDSYVLDTTNSSNCIPRPRAVGDLCQRIDDCQDVLGRAMCINGRCQCVTGYHYANETGKCITTRFMYHSCSKSYECLGFRNEDVLECRNGECVCKDGGCSKASLYAFVGIPLILLSFAHRLI